MMESAILIVTALCSFIMASAGHELGHVLVGLREGFKFHLFIAGPLGIRRADDDRIELYLERNVSLWGGLAATVPRTVSEHNYRKFGRVLLGGPLLSILVGAVCLPLGMASGSRLILMMAAMSLGMGIVTLLPLRNGAFYTDGGRWLRMQKSGKTRVEETALWNLTQQVIVAGSYSGADLDEISVLKNSADVRTRYVGHHYAFCYHRDNKDTSGMEREKALLHSMRGEVPRQMATMFSVD